MYGFLFYKINSGDKNYSSEKYYNQNYNAGIQLNADLKLAEGFSLPKWYAGYNRWNLGKFIFPIGLLLNQKVNKKPNEFYFKIRWEYTFGKPLW